MVQLTIRINTDNEQGTLSVEADSAPAQPLETVDVIRLLVAVIEGLAEGEEGVNIVTVQKTVRGGQHDKDDDENHY